MRERIGSKERAVRKALGSLIASVREFEDAADKFIIAEEKAGRIATGSAKGFAKLMNTLTYCNDSALYSGGLGFDFRQDHEPLGRRADRKCIMKVASRMYREAARP